MDHSSSLTEAQVDSLVMSSDSRYNQLAYQLSQVAQQHQQIDGQFQLVDSENFISSSSSTAPGFQRNQYQREKQMRQQASNNFHDTQVSHIRQQVCDFETQGCVRPGYSQDANNQLQICNDPFITQPMPSQTMNGGQQSFNCNQDMNGFNTNRLTLNNSVSNRGLYMQPAMVTQQQNYIPSNQFGDLKLNLTNTNCSPSMCSPNDPSINMNGSSQVVTRDQLQLQHQNQNQLQQQQQNYGNNGDPLMYQQVSNVTNDCDPDSLNDFHLMNGNRFNNQSIGDYLCHSTVNQLCAIEESINCNQNIISGYSCPQSNDNNDFFTSYRDRQTQQQINTGNFIPNESNDQVFDWGPLDSFNQASYSPNACSNLFLNLDDPDNCLNNDNKTLSMNNAKPGGNQLPPIGVKIPTDQVNNPNGSIGNINSRDRQAFQPTSNGQAARLPVNSFAAKSHNSNTILDGRISEQRGTTKQQQEEQKRQGLSISQQQRQHQMDLIEMRSNWNFSQDWLDSICRQLIDHMNKFGICVIDNFLGSVRGNLILKEVKQLYSSGQYINGRLASDRLLNDRNSNTDPGAIRNDRVIWVDGSENGCSEINNLIMTFSSVITNSSRLSFYSDNQLDKVVINRRTKAHVACYPGNGTRYVKHIDNPNGDGRLITSIYYLNKDWNTKREGGLLRMYPTGTNQVANIEPLFDRALFFWSDRRNPHEVLPAYKDRFAVTVWFIGEPRR